MNLFGTNLKAKEISLYLAPGMDTIDIFFLRIWLRIAREISMGRIPFCSSCAMMLTAFSLFFV